MTILGSGGVLRLTRANPEVVTLVPTDTNLSGTGFVKDAPGFISGDAVTAACPATLPISGYDTLTSTNLFVHISPVGTLSLCNTRIKAINGYAADLLPILTESFGTLTLTPLSNGWEYPAALTSWKLRTEANPIDTTALGETFSDSIKSIVSGGGDLDEYLITRTWRDNQAGGRVVDQLIFHQLTLMTRAGAKATAQFWLKNNSTNLLPGDLYYEADILFVSSVLDNSADELVSGSSSFITVGDIALRAQAELVAPNPRLYGCGP